MPLREQFIPGHRAQRVLMSVAPMRRIGLFLRTRTDGRCDRNAAKKCDELAPPHLITLSARTRNDSAIVSPRTFAVLRLITSSNLAGCSTRDVGDLDAAEELDKLLGLYLYKQLIEARSVRCKTAFLCRFGPFIDRRRRNAATRSIRS